MAKIDKSQYTKEEWHVIREQRRLEKERKRKEEAIKQAKIQKTDTTVKHSNRHSLKPHEHEFKTAFVIGNGTSRKTIDLDLLAKNGTTYGCNALYREFNPDYLIAVDTKMVLELNQNKVQNKLSVWTNPNRSYHKFSGFNFFNPSKGWSSGPTALWKASEDGHERIFILGFDYKGLGANQELVNNIYAGTQNYKKKNEKATYFGNWLKQTVITIQKNPKIRYIRVLDSKGFVPKELSKLSNLEHISIEDFKKIFEKTPSV